MFLRGGCENFPVKSRLSGKFCGFQRIAGDGGADSADALSAALPFGKRSGRFRGTPRRRRWRAARSTTQTRFGNLPPGFVLRPGMQLVADIKITRRSILEYVLNPLTRVVDKSRANPSEQSVRSGSLCSRADIRTA
jgi:hypothetical protein